MKTLLIQVGACLCFMVALGVVSAGEVKSNKSSALVHRKSGDGGTEFLYLAKNLAILIAHTPADERKVHYKVVLAHFERFPDLAAHTGDIVDQDLAIAVTHLKLVNTREKGGCLVGSAENPSVDIEIRRPQWFAFVYDASGAFKSAHWFFEKESLLKLTTGLGVEKLGDIPKVNEALAEILVREKR